MGTHNITRDDLRAQLDQETAFVRERYQGQAKLRQYLETMIRFQILVTEAERRGLDVGPNKTRAEKQLVINRMIDQELAASARVSEEAINAYWSDHQYDFRVPAKVRVAHILVRDAKVADEVAAKTLTLAPGDDARWAELVTKHSLDIRTRPKAGALDFLTRADRKQDPAVISAAFALKSPGDTTGPIKARDGLHILRLLERHESLQPTLQEARAEVIRKVTGIKRARALEEWLVNLRAGIKVEVFVEALAALAP